MSRTTYQKDVCVAITVFAVATSFKTSYKREPVLFAWGDGFFSKGRIPSTEKAVMGGFCFFQKVVYRIQNSKFPEL